MIALIKITKGTNMLADRADELGLRYTADDRIGVRDDYPEKGVEVLSYGDRYTHELFLKDKIYYKDEECTDAVASYYVYNRVDGALLEEIQMVELDDFVNECNFDYKVLKTMQPKGNVTVEDLLKVLSGRY